MPNGEIVVAQWSHDQCGDIVERIPPPTVSAGGSAQSDPAASPSRGSNAPRGQPLSGPTLTGDELAAMEAAGVEPEALAALTNLNAAMTGRMNALLSGVDSMEAQLDALQNALAALGEEGFEEFEEEDPHTST